MYLTTPKINHKNDKQGDWDGEHMKKKKKKKMTSNPIKHNKRLV